MATAGLVFTVIKRAFDRARPPVADRLVTVGNESLPSGHATMSMVVIGTIVVLSWRFLAGWRRTVLVVLGVAWVYLGVHWFSDVIAGWLVGAAWLAICATVWGWWRAR
jgi:undecaprenyl-diphosphatase